MVPFTQPVVGAHVCLKQAHSSTSCLGNFFSLVRLVIFKLQNFVVCYLVDTQMWRLLGTVAKEKRGLVRAIPPETRLLWVLPLQKSSRAICGGCTETAKWHAAGNASFAWSEAHSSMRCSWAKPQGRCERPQGTAHKGKKTGATLSGFSVLILEASVLEGL